MVFDRESLLRIRRIVFDRDISVRDNITRYLSKIPSIQFFYPNL